MDDVSYVKQVIIKGGINNEQLFYQALAVASPKTVNLLLALMDKKVTDYVMGTMPALYCVERGWLDSVKLVESLGADLTMKYNTRAFKDVPFVLFSGSPDVYNYIIAKTGPLPDGALGQIVNVATKSLDNAVLPSIPFTPYVLATIAHAPEMIQFFNEIGWNINKQYGSGVHATHGRRRAREEWLHLPDTRRQWRRLLANVARRRWAVQGWHERFADCQSAL